MHFRHVYPLMSKAVQSSFEIFFLCPKIKHYKHLCIDYMNVECGTLQFELTGLCPFCFRN